MEGLYGPPQRAEGQHGQRERGDYPRALARGTRSADGNPDDRHEQQRRNAYEKRREHRQEIASLGISWRRNQDRRRQEHEPLHYPELILRHPNRPGPLFHLFFLNFPFLLQLTLASVPLVP